MAKISESMHRFVHDKLSKAADVLDASRGAIPAASDYTHFERAVEVVRECQSVVDAEQDIDAIAERLREASARLRRFCGGPAEAAVNAAILLIDQATGGEIM